MKNKDEREWREVAEWVGEKTNWNFDDLVDEAEIFINHKIIEARNDERNRIIKGLAEMPVMCFDANPEGDKHKWVTTILYDEVKDFIKNL